jgi:hypothetical protein
MSLLGGIRDSGFESEHDCLHPIAQAKLVEDVGDVGLGGVLGDVELGGDLGIRETPGEETEHLFLSGGECGEGWRGLPRRFLSEALDEPPGDSRGEKGPTLGDDPDAG